MKIVYYKTLSFTPSMSLEQVRMLKAEQLFLFAQQGKNEAVRMMAYDLRKSDPSPHNRVHMVQMTIVL